MIRLGASPSDSREMDIDDIFILRLKLLVIMAKAFLDGCPVGEIRREAMYDNACYLEIKAFDLGNLGRILSEDSPLESSEEAPHYDHVFFQRVKLLAVMVKAVAKGFPVGEHREAAMFENIEAICQTLMFNSKMESVSFLKVA